MTAAFEPPPGAGFDLQQVYAEKKTPFWFRWADRWWQFPHLLMLDFEVQAQVEDFHKSIDGVTDMDALRGHFNDLFTLIMGAEQSAEWAQVTRPLPAVMTLLNQWLEHSGSDAGESEASAGSSKSTGRPSKRTSTGTTASGSRRRSPAKKAATPPANS